MSKIVLFILSFIFLNAEQCQKEYEKYPDLNGMWSIRMSDKIDLYGCKVIPIYEMLKKANAISVMDAIDDNHKILLPLFNLKKHKEILNLIFRNDLFKSLILDNAINPKILSNLNYLFDKHLNYSMIHNLKQNPNYIYYFLIPAIEAKNKTELQKYYNKLKGIYISKLPAFSLIYINLRDKYNLNDLLDNFLTIKKSLSKKQLNLIVEYPEEFIYFLYPPKEDLGSGYNLSQKQKKFQHLIIDIYKDIYSSYTTQSPEIKNQIALSFIDKVYPYIVNKHNYNDIKILFHELNNYGFLKQIFINAPLCSDKIDKNFYILFGDERLNNLIALKNNYPSLYYTLLKSNSKAKSIFLMAYVANVLHSDNFTYVQKQIFKSLLKDLSPNLYANIYILTKLEKIGYFKNITNRSDYKYYVKANEDDMNGFSAPKYKYILVTSYPAQTDPSVLDYLSNNQLNKAKNLLDKLYYKSISDLERHTFTTKDKTMYFLNIADNIITIASIVAIPFTAGVSGEYLLAKQGAKTSAKTTFKVYIKTTAKKLSKKILIQSKKLAKNSYTKKYIAITQKIENIDNKFSVFHISLIGATIFFALPNNLQAKQLCPKGE